MDYFWGFLHIHLERAEIKGKPSQDPFALVYLHNEATGLSTFQIENNGTETHDKNINPVFSHDFYFRVNYFCRNVQTQQYLIFLDEKL